MLTAAGARQRPRTGARNLGGRLRAVARYYEHAAATFGLQFPRNAWRGQASLIFWGKVGASRRRRTYCEPQKQRDAYWDFTTKTLCFRRLAQLCKKWRARRKMRTSAWICRAPAWISEGLLGKNRPLVILRKYLPSSDPTCFMGSLSPLSRLRKLDGHLRSQPELPRHPSEGCYCRSSVTSGRGRGNTRSVWLHRIP